MKIKYSIRENIIRVGCWVTGSNLSNPWMALDDSGKIGIWQVSRIVGDIITISWSDKREIPHKYKPTDLMVINPENPKYSKR